jgi:hypothetical protein
MISTLSINFAAGREDEPLFSWDARIARSRLVAGHVLALILAWVGMLAARTGTTVILILVGALGGGLIAKLLVEGVRRRHDMGRRGTPVIALSAGGVMMMAAASIYALGTGPFVVFYAASMMLGLAWASLLLRPGTANANRFGMAISNPLIPTFGEPRGFHYSLLAMALIAAGAGLGYIGGQWNAGLRERHAANERYAASIDEGENRAALNDLELDYLRNSNR